MQGNSQSRNRSTFGDKKSFALKSWAFRILLAETSVFSNSEVQILLNHLQHVRSPLLQNPNKNKADRPQDNHNPGDISYINSVSAGLTYHLGWKIWYIIHLLCGL